MKIIFFISILFAPVSCEKKNFSQHEGEIKISDKVSYFKSKDKVVLKSGSSVFNFRSEEISFHRAVVLNTTMLGYMEELGLEDRIVGVANPKYIYSEKIHRLIREGKIKDIGTDQKYDVEKILALRPDLVLTNYIPSFENIYCMLQSQGIEVVFLDEYLENTPLSKAKYLEVFGLLFGKEKQAKERYQQIKKSYEALKDKALKTETRPLVLCNELYGNTWFLPGGKTFVATYLHDAGGAYLLRDNLETRSVPFSFEEVFVRAKGVRYWVNLSDAKERKHLLLKNPLYAKMEAFQRGYLYAMTHRKRGEANDYFESGAVRVDLVLKDYLQIFHRELFPKDTLTYMNEIK